MSMDWLKNNWEIYFSFAFALAIMWMVFFKQEFESLRASRKEHDEEGQQGNLKKKKRTKKTGGGKAPPANAGNIEKDQKDSD